MTADDPAWKAALRDALSPGGGPVETDRLMTAVLPHIEAAYRRGLAAGASRAGYRLTRENERLRRELRGVRKDN
ncbi:hypothetical protein ACK1X7_07205 [Streptomyces sp. CY1]|uniref:hypothetical protein n=1 Tax=Streptomyces sp. CY1 TaxID=3388313 RepID=UPI0039A10490